jgi:hypothetical protein
MLPASDLSDILANLAALNLQPNTTAAILAAVLAPLLRSSEPERDASASVPWAARSRRPGRRARSKPRSSARQKRKYRRHAPSEARNRALAALQANPEATPTEVAKIAKVSRSTVVIARNKIEKEARKAARKAMPSTISKPAERRQRAQRFLQAQLANGPRRVTDVEEAAAKAHVDPQALEQARGDLGIVVSRSNAGGVQAVQWSLPG